MPERTELSSCKRIVVKVGTSTITHTSGFLNFGRIDALSRELSDLRNSGKEIALVTSGAVGAGMARLGLKERPKTIPGKQAAAAVGQGILMHIYEKSFSEYSQTVAQVLLTKDDAIDRDRYANSRNTILELFSMGVIPIINENDVVAVDELKIGDNDTLSALVAAVVDADLLVILSDIDGFYTSDPRTNPDATLVSEVPEIDEATEARAGGAGSPQGTGGMATKLGAAKIATASGIPLVLASGSVKDPVIRIVSGEEIGTRFAPRISAFRLRKRWLAFGSKLRGSIVVDDGCRSSIVSRGASLLPAGILAVEGSFSPGDTVAIRDTDGREIARGIAQYASLDIERVKSKRSSEAATVLGEGSKIEIVHRDDMALLVQG